MRYEKSNAERRLGAVIISDPDEPPIFDDNDTSATGSLTAESSSTTAEQTPCKLQSAQSQPQASDSPVLRAQYSGSIVVRLADSYKFADDGDFHALIERTLRHEREKRRKVRRAMVLGDDERLDIESLALLSRSSCRRLVSDLDKCKIDELDQKAAKTSLPPIHSLASYWRLDARHVTGKAADGLVQLLLDLPEVAHAYRELAATDPLAHSDPYSEHQHYLDRAPIGIDARWAWEQLVAGESAGDGVQVIDLEQGWVEHQDVGPIGSPILGDNRDVTDPSYRGNHGTAVLGQLVAKHGNGGAVGIAPGSRFHLLSHFHRGGSSGGISGCVAEAIEHALQEMDQEGNQRNLREGDVLLIEVQRSYLPTEVDEADFNAIRKATALGLIVVEAAGNGGIDLDAYRDASGRAILNRENAEFRESGAIMIGAAESNYPNNRARFSNYGSRLDCYAWGDGVVTSGYGDLDGLPSDNYTQVFGGTSSAAPIVAGAALIIQGLCRSRSKTSLAPSQMREILSDPTTGTPQGDAVPGRIGVMPDLKAILERLNLAPRAYLRSREGDTGEESHDRIVGCCPDLHVTAATGGQQFQLDVRNRGLEEARVSARIYRSELEGKPVVATLVPPVSAQPGTPPAPAWELIQKTAQEGIQPGNVAKSITATGNANVDYAQPSSFLVVLDHDNEPPVALPPERPYFRWRDFLAFNRQHARRSVVAGPWSKPQSFYIVGAPDHPRAFDFEILQSLPVNTQVVLTVPRLLAVALWQDRIPHLSSISGRTEELKLPRQPRTSFTGVRLGAGVPYEATFGFVVDAKNPLEEGHNLVIRQLFEGEEIGRITWEFDGT